jgi:aminoglycoside phosphotransferase (APT) family kinase protein
VVSSGSKKDAKKSVRLSEVRRALQGGAMAGIDVELARRLLRAQFPHWAHLAVTDVAEQGWDNRTFRLGDAMKLRLPSAAVYAAQVEKEARWLTVLAANLPVTIPEVMAVGVPGEGYAWPWSVQGWVEGRPAHAGSAGVELARDVAGFLLALRGVESSDGPAAGAHSFHRGGELRVYDAEARAAVDVLRGEIDGARALAVWDAALESRWDRAPVWVHGDVAAGNLLVRDGRLSGVIDFGCMAVSDTACDLTVAWTLFEGETREVFRREVALDGATWARARGWALWKAMITMARDRGDAQARRVIGAALG